MGLADAKEVRPEDVGFEPQLEWGELLPLPTLAPDPADIPPDMLPNALRPWIMDAAQRASIHVAFIAVIALTSLGAVIGRTLGIHPKQYDDWQEVPNLWGAIVAPPSSLKSHAVTEGTAPLRRLAAQATKASEAARADSAVDAEMLKLELAALKNKAKGKKANPDDFRDQIKEAMDALSKLETATEKRYIVNDTTMEKAGELLKDNPRGLLYQKDELVGLLKACDKPGNETYRPFLLESWNGKGTYTFDRIGRGTLHIPAVTLSLVGGIQPGKLRNYISGAMGNGDGADGLLQRFQLLVWFDRAAPYKKAEETDRYPDADAKNRAFEVFAFLDRLPESDLIEKPTGEYVQHDAIPGLRFTPEAQTAFNTWLDAHMLRLRSDELAHTPAFQAHLAKYSSLVASLALIFHLTDLAEHRELTTLPRVSLSALELAIRWTEYLELHARKLYSSEINTDILSALALSERIEAGEVEDGAKLSDIYRKGFPHLTAKAEVEAATKVLEEVQHVRIIETKNKGARASYHLRINPELLEGEK